MRTPWLVVGLTATMLMGCGGGDDVRVADFSLTDVNPTSATSGQQVSPTDYIDRVSAWYFTHAT